MKPHKLIAGIGFFILLSVAITALAADVSLTNGGLGQRSGAFTSFGVAVCNSGASVFSGTVPVIVVANGVAETVSVTAFLEPVACAYSYVPYSMFNMIPGGTYSITVTIDPDHTMITNLNNQETYVVTAPPLIITTPGFPNAGVPPVSQIQMISIDLMKGSSGNDVAILQQFLISRSTDFAAEALAQAGATGYFGVLTQAALADFQLNAGISPPQGFFGPITRAYISTH